MIPKGRKWCVMDLVTDHQTGKLRETAVWSNVGKGTLTWAVVYQTLHNGLTEWLVLAFGGIVVLHESATRLLNQRQQNMDKEPHHEP